MKAYLSQDIKIFEDVKATSKNSQKSPHELRS